jgi:WG containing repeat
MSTKPLKAPPTARRRLATLALRRAALGLMGVIGLTVLSGLGAAHAAWWDNRYAVLKADGLVTGYLAGLGSYELDGRRAAVGPANRVGFLDSTAGWVIPEQFGRTLEFHQGRAVVWRDVKEPPFFIDRSGNRVGDAPEQAQGFVDERDTDIFDLLAYTRNRQGQRVTGIRTRDWRTLLEVAGDKTLVARGDQIVQFHERSRVERHFDLQGQVIFDKPMPWDVNRPTSDAIFSRGLALRLDPKSGWGYINTAGDWVIQPRFWQATVFGEDGAVVAERQGDDGLFAGRLIDAQGNTVRRLPPARCYTEVSRGLLLARVPGAEKHQVEMALMTTTGEIIKRLPIAPSDAMCPARLRWMDEQTLVAGRYWLRRDGSVVHDGLGDVRYDEIMAIQPATGSVVVRWENNSAPKTVEQHRIELAARKNSLETFYESVQLRPFTYGDWAALKEPDFHLYKAVRLYVDDRWPGGSSFDYHLHAMVVQVKVRDGRPAHDNTRVLAEAGCRVPPGWKLVKSDILVVPKRYWFGSEYEDWMDWVRSATGAKHVLWSQNGRQLCQHELLVDGKLDLVSKP